MKFNGKNCSSASQALAFGAGLVLLLYGGSCSPLSDYGNRTARITVIIEGEGSVTGVPADSTLAVGSRLQLTAEPRNGMVFIAWRAPSFSTSLNPLDIRVDRDLTIKACFAEPPAGLALVRAKNSSFLMGSSGPFSQESESPVHTVRFRYDYYIGRHEVTQGEYAALTGSIPKTGAGAFDIGDSFPVYNVSWYDAVLYCNVLSKRQGYDTVYSYSNVCNDPACPWILDNLETHYDRFGYRLPTEAEWEFACRAGSATDYFWGSGADAEKAAAGYAWYYVNANDQSQKVARRKPNAFGLFDMAGNVAEWVGDWLWSYPDTAVFDPVGPAGLSQQQYETTHERPVRGGSWRLGAAFLRSSCRKGPYPASAFVVMKDIGFRVALGAFSPDTVVRPPKANDSLPVTLACGTTDLFSFIGTPRIKLAFVANRGERRELVFFDFTAGTQARRCGNDASVYCPSISPDGNHVAYSSNREGFAGPCTLTVRTLDSNGGNPVTTNGYIPRFWASDTSRDTFVIYTDGTSPSGANPRWYTEKTYRKLFRGGAFSGEAQVVWGQGSYHGGLSSDGRFLGTSYQVARVVDLQIKDTNIFYFAKPFNGRPNDLTDYPQTCNLSMSPSLSDPGEALLLDFGYPYVSTLLGKSYGMHAVIFICNTRVLVPAHVSQWFEKPSGYDQWDDTEWSNHSGFIVAVARAGGGGDDALYIIRRTDSAYLKVATGRSLSHPALWIDPAQVSQVNDPFRWFGAYDIPQQWNGQVILARKLRLFWHYRATAEYIAIGSSPMYFGLDPSFLSFPTLNIASWGADMKSDITILMDYVLPHTPRLKAIVLDLMPGFFNRKTYPALLGLIDCKGYELDARYNFYKSGIPAQVESRAAAFSQRDWDGLNASGYDLYPPEGAGWGLPIIDKGDYDINDSIAQYSLSLLDELSDSVAARGVHLLIVSFPESPAYASTSVIGRYGPGRETYRKIVSRVEEIANNNRFVHFYDANNYGNHDYTSSEARDCNHLNFRGAKKLSARIDSLLNVSMQQDWRERRSGPAN